MITDRPKFLLENPSYTTLPPLPLGLDLSSVPHWIKMSMLHLGGVQPITSAMANAAGFVLQDTPTEGELELYQREERRFQTVMVVTSVAGFRLVDGIACGVPYAISLIPANKRGSKISEVDVQFVRRMDLNQYMRKNEPCFFGFDPFTGNWSLFGPVSLLNGQAPSRGFADELGLVTDMYFLQLGIDLEDALTIDLGFVDDRARQKYHRHRTRLMFSPFRRMEARRVWGAESPIELFLLQALLRRDLSPLLQMLLFEDGTMHPSLYHLWNEGLDQVPSLITEADMYFPERRVAVFCDSTRHHRGAKSLNKDALITDRLRALGISSVRVPGPMIVRDLRRATDLVCEALV